MLVARVFVYELGKLCDLVHTYEDVDLRHTLGQLITISLGQTTRYDKHVACTRLLMLGHLKDSVDRLCPGILDKRAGIHDYDLGMRRIVGQDVALVDEAAQHHLAVDLVLGTPQAYKTDGFHDNIVNR